MLKENLIENLSSQLEDLRRDLRKSEDEVCDLNHRMSQMVTTWENERDKTASDTMRLVNNLLEKNKVQSEKLTELKELNDSLLLTIESFSVRENDLGRKYDSLLLKVKCYDRLFGE
jgi:hypothetical protein